MRNYINILLAFLLVSFTAHARTFNSTESISIIPASGTELFLKSDSAAASLPLKLDAAKAMISGQIDLTTEVTGTLPAGNGGNVAESLTATQVAFGDGSNLVSSSPSLIFNDTTKELDITGGLRLQDDGYFEIFEAVGNGTDSVIIQVPSSLAASYSLTLPVDDGTANQFLQTDGNGVLSFATPSGGAGASGTHDRLIGAGGNDTDLGDFHTNATAGDSGFVSTETVSGSATFTKQLAVFGGGFGSQSTGTIHFATGSDGSSLEDIRINGNVYIDLGVKNVRITDCWVVTGFTIYDNSGNTSNLVNDCLVEE